MLLKEALSLVLQAKALSDKGELVPDDVISGMLEERLSREDVANGFILDGYPRNLAQAESLDILLERLNQPVEEAILIDIDPEQIIKRIAKRAQEEGRADDTEETVRNRLQVYEEQTAPVADYYAERGLLTRVLGDGNVERNLSAHTQYIESGLGARLSDGKVFSDRV